MSSKSIFVLLADGQSAVYSIFIMGVILERNGLHVKPAMAALKG